MRGQMKLGSSAIAAGSMVRPEYLNLPRELEELARGFNLELPADCQRDAAILVFAIECVDRILDSIPDESAREQFITNVMTALRGRMCNESDLFTREVQERLTELHKVIQRREISISFCCVTSRILQNSEQMRATRRPAYYVNAAVEEGQLMVELLLLILGEAVPLRFREFMREIGGPANLGDKLRDARVDFLLGELAIKPGFMFYLRLGGGMLWRIGAITVRFCVYHRILIWGLKSLYHELALPRHRTV